MSGNMEKSGVRASAAGAAGGLGSGRQQDGLCLLTSLGINQICWASPSKLPWEIRCGMSLELSGNHAKREIHSAWPLVLQAVSSLVWLFSRYWADVMLLIFSGRDTNSSCLAQCHE